jgi:hypothetical protein
MKKLMVLLVLIITGSFAFAQFGPGSTNSGTYSSNRTSPRFGDEDDSSTGSHSYSRSFSESDCALLIELYEGELIKEAHDEFAYRGTCPSRGYTDYGSAYQYYKLNNGKVLVIRYAQTYKRGRVCYIYEKGYYLNEY